MPKIDCSVYVKFQNNTDETLVNGRTDEGTIHDSGKWIEFPSSIPAHSSSSFKLVETAWFTGSSGIFSYEIVAPEHENPLVFQAFQLDAYTGRNAIVCNSPSPPSAYALSFAARVADREWKQGDDPPPTGHPLYVTYTLEDYAHSLRNQFRLVKITAISAYSIRNSRGDLIAGQHTLWNPSEDYIDENRGSLAPNVFKYEFGSQVAASGILRVTVRPIRVDRELLRTEVILYATRDGKQVIQSDYFTFPAHFTDVTVQARVIDPATSATPFLFNAEVTWEMEFRDRKNALQRFGPGVTRLELYWIATTLHPAFASGIPITFLRNVLVPIEKMTVQATNIEFYQYMTKRVFNDYNKLYDTISSRAGFGVEPWGGNFNVTLYLQSQKENHQPGTLYRYVNCMDQAAMLELSCSLLSGFHAPTWLSQTPFGYINTTHLVGIRNAAGALMNINNPTFGTDKNLAEVGANDKNRRFFSIHVYLGHSHPWKRTDDGIYDACTGPHLGTETIQQYVTNVIDTKTTLYDTVGWTPAGTVDNVKEEEGVVTIDGQTVFSHSRTIPGPLTETLSRLINTVVANTNAPLAHTGWAYLPIWLNATLGDAWDIQYEQVSVGETGTQALWLISNTTVSDSPIHVHITVASVSTQDGNFDTEQSAAIVKEDLGNILMSTERQDIWISGTLPGLEGVSLQYANHVAAGRIVVVAGNVLMDISGMTSYEELLPYALKLLNRTVRHLCHLPPIVPVITRQAIRMGTTDTSGTTTFREPVTTTGIVTVTGTNTRFSLIFSVSCKIATANAGSEGHGVLFDRHIIKEPDNGEGCTVEFRFIAWEVGFHRVRVCVADLETMIVAKSDLEVEVLSA